MSVVKISYKLSEKARNAEGVAAGKMPNWIQTVEVEFADFTENQRAELLKFWRFDHRGWMEIDLSNPATSKAQPSTLDARLKAKSWLRTETVKFDQIMSTEMVLSTLFAQIDRRAELLKQIAPKVAEAEAEAEALAAEKARLKAEAEAVLEKAASIADDESALRDLLFTQTPQEVREFRFDIAGNWNDRQMVSVFINRYLKRFDEARKEAKEKAEAEEKATWIEEHGSERLKLAARRGHETGRLYVIERAAQQFPDWTVDFQGKAQWSDRTNPPLGELKNAEEAERQTGKNVDLVWLTAPPVEHPRPSDDYWYEPEPFEQRPALVLKWFGKYLVKEI